MWAQSPVLANPSACALGIPLRDFTCSDDGAFYNPDRIRIEVNDAPGERLGGDVFLSQVRLIIRHGWTGDLDLSLVSPAGRRVLLTSDNGGGDDNYGQAGLPDCSGYVAFSTESCLPISEGTPPFAEGPYRPEEPLLRFNDGSDPRGLWTLEICDDVVEDLGVLEFVHLVFEPVTCLPVSEVLLLGIDTTTVLLDWRQRELCGTTLIEYGPPGFTPGRRGTAGQGTLVRTTDCPPYRLQGLAPESDYEVYVRKFCTGSNNYSANSCPVRVRTGCAPPPPTISDHFDDLPVCQPLCGQACPIESGTWRNSGRDDADWIVYTGATPTRATGPESGVGGQGNYLYLEATEGQDCRAGTVAFLSSGCIRFNKQGSDTCHLSFNYHLYGTDIGTLRLEVSSDGGFNWRPLWEKRGDQGAAWQKVYLGLADIPDGQVVRFRFAGIKGEGAVGDMAIDEIVFFGSESLGPPDTFFYADADGDGFGDSDDFIATCGGSAPTGFVSNGADCNDSDPLIFPGQDEVPCDRIDNNCNGLDDDVWLPPPIGINDTICSGEVAEVCAATRSDKLIFWYGSPDGNDFLGEIGPCYRPDLPENNSSEPLVYRFYAEETDFVCRSVERTEVLVVVYPNPVLSTAEAPAICPGQSIDLSGLQIDDAHFTGGVLSFHEELPATEANRLASPLVSPAGNVTYGYRMTAPGGCTDEGLLSIAVKPGPSLTFSTGDSIGLCRDDSERIAVSAAGGASPYAYRWSTGETSSAIEVEAAFQDGRTDRYAVTVTDAEGCFSADTVQVTTRNSINAVRRAIDPVSACMGSDGRITLTPLDGAAPYQFAWRGTNGQRGVVDGVQDSAVIEGLRQGAYRITITDASTEACAFLMRSVLVNGPNAAIEEPRVTPVTCAGTADGSICLDVSGSNPRFRWSNGDTTQCLENIAGGTYRVTVTDGMCQTVLTGIEVREPVPLSLQMNAILPSCAGASDGQLELTALGGNGDYRYQWSTAASGRALTGLPAGTYRVTVTDAAGCMQVDSAILIAPDLLSIATIEQADMSCAGISDGQIQVEGVGGTAPYRYNWSTGSTSSQLASLTAGSYTLTLTDFQGCQTLQSFSIEEPAPLDVSIVEQIDPRCVGDFNGRIRATATGGTPGYVYEWSTGGTDSLLSGLGVGRYALVVEDSNACRSDTVAVTLESLSTLDLAVAIVPPTCIGAADGSIDLRPSGAAPFTYRWTNGSTGAQLNEVETGVYSLTIEDARGCLYDTAVVVEAPQAFNVEFNVLPPSCSGGSDGVISPIILSGGEEPLSYRWSNGNTTSSLFGVRAGAYAVTITDIRDCRYASDTLQVAEPPPLSIAVAAIGKIDCRGDSTGFIELQANGGVAPYQYNWLNYPAGEGSAIFNLAAGQYRVQVLDANGCPEDAIVGLPAPPPLQVSIDISGGDICEGEAGNDVTLLTSGGVAPYRYTWSNGSRDTVLTDLAPGDYALTVEDANNCVERPPSIKIREVVEPLLIDTFMVEDITCNGAADGSLTARISGGKPPFRFHFSNNEIVVTSSREVARSGLPRNSRYNVTVTDLNTGCAVVSERLPLTEPPPLSLRLDSLDQVRCFEGVGGAIYTSTLGGRSPYGYQWRDTLQRLVGSTADLLRIGAGRYTGIVIDQSGCIDTLSAVEIQSLNPPLRRVDSLTMIRNAVCKGGRSGAIDLTIAGGAPPYQYAWSNGRLTQDIDSLAAGSYGLTVTDSEGCRSILSPLAVGEPDLAVTVSGTGVNASCYGYRDGRIQSEVRGGIPPYDLTWIYQGATIAEDVLDLDSIPAGNYQLVVRDQAGCRRVFPFDVGQPDSLKVSITVEAPAPGESGRLRAIVQGGTPGYFYRWSTGALGAVLEEDLQAGGYGLTVTDANFCMAFDSVFLTSVYQTPLIEELRLFPNPSAGPLTLELRLQEPLPVRLLLLNAQGQAIRSRTWDPLFSGQYPLDFSRLPAGTYQLLLYGDQQLIYSGKVVLMGGG